MEFEPQKSSPTAEKEVHGLKKLGGIIFNAKAPSESQVVASAMVALGNAAGILYSAEVHYDKFAIVSGLAFGISAVNLVRNRNAK